MLCRWCCYGLYPTRLHTQENCHGPHSALIRASSGVQWGPGSRPQDWRNVQTETGELVELNNCYYRTTPCKRVLFIYLDLAREAWLYRAPPSEPSSKVRVNGGSPVRKSHPVERMTVSPGKECPNLKYVNDIKSKHAYNTKATFLKAESTATTIHLP